MISLLRTPERTREGFQVLLPDFPGLELMPACDGKAELAHLPVPPDCKIQPGECGICHSWWKIAVQVIRRGVPYAIGFEDDVQRIKPGDVEAAIQTLPSGWDFALLHDGVRPEPVVESEHGVWRKVKVASWGTPAVAMSHSGALKMLTGLMPYTRAVDNWIRDFACQMNVYQPMPGEAWFTQHFWHPSECREPGIAPERIPRKIHRIWLGGKAMPDEFVSYGASWAAKHPGYEMKLWKEEDLIAEFGPLLIAGHPAELSDIYRLKILERFGGLYVDTDFQCLRPFDRLLQSCSLLIPDIHEGVPCNGLLASSPGNRLMKRMVEMAEDPSRAGLPILERAGPALVKQISDPWRHNAFTKDLIDGGQVIGTAMGDSGLVVIRPEVLFPYYWADEKPDDYGNAWAVHHWARSWWTEEHWENFREAKRKSIAIKPLSSSLYLTYG